MALLLISVMFLPGVISHEWIDICENRIPNRLGKFDIPSDDCPSFIVASIRQDLTRSTIDNPASQLSCQIRYFRLQPCQGIARFENWAIWHPRASSEVGNIRRPSLDVERQVFLQ